MMPQCSQRPVVPRSGHTPSTPTSGSGFSETGPNYLLNTPVANDVVQTVREAAAGRRTRTLHALVDHAGDPAARGYELNHRPMCLTQVTTTGGSPPIHSSHRRFQMHASPLSGFPHCCLESEVPGISQELLYFSQYNDVWTWPDIHTAISRDQNCFHEVFDYFPRFTEA